MYMIFFVLMTGAYASAGDFNFRFREHYDYSSIEYAGSSNYYKGFSNTFNLWYEEPFKLSYGLAAGSLFSFSTTDENVLNGLSKTIRFYFIGAEAKYFPYESVPNLFTRIGLYWDVVDTKSNIGKLNGWSYYAGIGWETLSWKILGLAPEIGIKQGDAQGIFHTSIQISFGIHFYDYRKMK